MPTNFVVATIVLLISTLVSTYFTYRTEKHYTVRDNLLIIVFAIIGLVSAIFAGWAFFHRTPPVQQISALARLDEIQKSLSELSVYVDQQKREIRATDIAVSALREEQTKLEPVVRTNRELVANIIQAANASQRRLLWVDRLVAFAIGVLSSVVAASLVALISRRRSSR